MYGCHFCHSEVDNPREVFRTSVCSKCGKDLKICLNCRFYNPGAHWDCSESIDEPVKDKDRSNFCSFFAFRDYPTGESGQSKGTEAARKQLDKLFGDG
jgi:hypothetical protein